MFLFVEKETESWHLLSPTCSSDAAVRPSGRHKHSAVLHDDAMWIYGGMTDLQERNDFWRWDTSKKRACAENMDCLLQDTVLFQ